MTTTILQPAAKALDSSEPKHCQQAWVGRYYKGRPSLRSLASWIFGFAATMALAAEPTSTVGDTVPDRAFLDALPDEVDQVHEGIPDGVPSTYDWQRRGKRDRWNNPPANFTAITGWGQAFWARGNNGDNLTLQLRNHQTWLCQNNVWGKVQASVPTGGQYRADFSGNSSRSPKFVTVEGGTLSVQFDPGSAYHFWPAEGRVEIPSQRVCGLRVLVQARVLKDDPKSKDKLLLGLGADYWLNRTSSWDNYKTNSAVGIGKLRIVTADWQWFGFGTAK